MIQFKLELNREHKTINKLTIDGKDYYLSENELEDLITDLDNYRPDIFENISLVEEKDREIRELKSDTDSLEDDASNLMDQLDDLQEELEELRNNG